MKYTHMGRSRVMISKVGLGTMNFGPASGKKQSLEILDKALECKLDEELLKRLDSIWPGPVEAPEAYAW